MNMWTLSIIFTILVSVACEYIIRQHRAKMAKIQWEDKGRNARFALMSMLRKFDLDPDFRRIRAFFNLKYRPGPKK